MSVSLPVYITLSEATRRYRVSRGALTRLVESGRVRAVKIDGGIAVAEEDVKGARKRDALWERVRHLDGVPICVSEAAERYRLSTGSVTRWVKAGYIRVLRKGDPKGGRGRKTHLNEADVAYAKLASEQRQSKPGGQVFTAEFLPVFIVGEAP
jgi:predicted site-specific integrase-resolvase